MQQQRQPQLALALQPPDPALADARTLATQPWLPNMLSANPIQPVKPRSESCVGSCTDAGIDRRGRQEVLWQHLFSDPSEWWDIRTGKKGPRHPDFRHKISKEALWLNSPNKPAWVDPQLARWDVGMREPPVFGAGDGGEERKCMVAALRRRCEEAELSDALEALHLLVQQGSGAGETLGVLYLVLKRCMAEGNLVCGRQAHAFVVKCGYEGNAFLATHMIGMYASYGKLEDAMQVFTKVSAPTVHMWSSIILAHAKHGQPMQALELYRRMRESSVEPNNHVFAAVLKACASAEDLDSGQEVHADLQASPVQADMFVCNSLVTMYARCGSVADARKVFDSLPRRDVVTWTALIAGYAQRGLGREALALYERMQQEGMHPADQVTFVCLLQACASVGALQQGKQLHLQVRSRGMEADTVLGNCLVNLYAKCGSLEDARSVFDRLPKRDVVTWTAMISGYTRQGFCRDALAMYTRMRKEGITPANHVTFVCLLQACASVGALQLGKELHSQIREQGLEGVAAIGNCLVDMYGKCGNLEEARDVFARLPTRDLVTWTALLNGYAQHNEGEMAISCFEQMLLQGIKPDETSFICLLVACSHAGLVREGQQFFRMMVEDHGLEPSERHYSCMVDLLGRSGQLDDAEQMLQTTSLVNDVVGWTALLSACKSHGDVARGRRCFDRLVELDAGDASPYVLLGNIYANAGRWQDVERIETWRKVAGAVKKPAKACIEVKDEVHEFTVGEESPDIFSKLCSVNLRVKEEGGHVPQTDLVLKEMSEKEKEDALCGHAEKLALAYGLLNTPDGTPLLVTKSLRMCNDCHSSTKVMSHLENREIIVRDAHRVHRFRDGSCSCNDRH